MVVVCEVIVSWVRVVDVSVVVVVVVDVDGSQAPTAMTETAKYMWTWPKGKLTWHVIPTLVARDSSRGSVNTARTTVCPFESGVTLSSDVKRD